MQLCTVDMWRGPFLHATVDSRWGESPAVIFHSVLCRLYFYFWGSWCVDIRRGHSLLCLFGVLCHTVDIWRVPASCVEFYQSVDIWRGLVASLSLYLCAPLCSFPLFLVCFVCPGSDRRLRNLTMLVSLFFLDAPLHSCPVVVVWDFCRVSLRRLRILPYAARPQFLTVPLCSSPRSSL